MSDTITITGNVGKDPKHIVTSEGLAITSFRVGSRQRRWDRKTNAWVDADTNWYSVSAFRQLAINAAQSLKQGDAVVITGRLRVREWEAGDKRGVNVELEAEAIGHDLTWGTSSYTKVRTGEAASQSAASSQESVPVPF